MVYHHNKLVIAGSGYPCSSSLLTIVLSIAFLSGAKGFPKQCGHIRQLSWNRVHPFGLRLAIACFSYTSRRNPRLLRQHDHSGERHNECDMDLIRKILLECEAAETARAPSPLTIEGYTEAQSLPCSL